MKTVQLKFISRLSWIIFFCATAWSCQDETSMKQLTPEEQRKQAEQSAVMSSNFVAASHDVLDLTAGAIAGQGVTNGRTSSYGNMTGPEINCQSNISGTFNIDKNHPDSVVFTGTLTIDFGDGSTCKDSTDVLKGKISDTFVLLVGKKVANGYDLTETIAFTGFHKDTVAIDGSFIAKSTSHTVSSLTIQDVKITYDNGAFSTWSGSLTNTYKQGPEWGSSDDSKEVTGSLTVTPSTGPGFSATITKAILFQYSCSKKIPVSGTIDLNINNVASTVDFGDGTCDKTYTITTNGVVTEAKFPVKSHHGGDDDNNDSDDD